VLVFLTVQAPLFPSINEKKVLQYTHSLDGGHFKTKDFRTLVGTELAHRLVKEIAIPASEKETEKIKKGIATKVSKVLGNTPKVALESYIDPVVWQSLTSIGA